MGAAPATCTNCGEPFVRRTCEQVCPDCLAPLARLRGRVGLTAVELASRVGCQPNTIAALERDERHPTLALARRIAAVVDTDVIAVFPTLAITKGEATRELGMTSRDLATLCRNGVLPCDNTGHWHRIPFVAVLALAAEREELRRDWISLNAAEAQFDLPRWVLRRLIHERRLHERIVGADSRRPTRYVRRDELGRVRQALLEEHQHLRCPVCRKRLKLGRKAHSSCLGALGARLYWRLDESSVARAERAAEHSRLVEQGLRRRLVRDVETWYRTRFRLEPTRALVGRWSGRRGGGRPSVETLLGAAEVAAIRSLKAKRPKLGYGGIAILRSAARGDQLVTLDRVRSVLKSAP